MLRRIFVALDPSSYAESAMKYAIHVAGAHGAEVTGFAVLDEPGIGKSFRRVSPGAAAFAEKAEQKREAAAHKSLQDVLATFARYCDEVGVEHREIEVAGDPAKEIMHESALYDLIVIGLETHFHFETSDKPDRGLTKLIGRLLTPVLAVPDSFVPFSDQLNVLIAYDGSPASIRSLQQFTQLAAFSNPKVVLLTSHDNIEAAEGIAAPAEEYLKAYQYTDVVRSWTPVDIIDAVRDEYLDQVDLIVAGMHAKRGLIEIHVGSFARFLTREAHRPVFFGQ